MPRTPITPQSVTAAGLHPVYEPANASGNALRLGPGRLLHIKNGSGASVTVTIPTPLQVDGLDVTDRTIAIPAGEDRAVGLGTASAYRQPGGVANVDYSATTSVTVAVLTVP